MAATDDELARAPFRLELANGLRATLGDEHRVRDRVRVLGERLVV